MSHFIMYLNTYKYRYDLIYILPTTHLNVISITSSPSQAAHGIGNFDNIVSGRFLL
jgi:hypothetical protein